MAGDTVITVVGNLTADPELRFTPSGAAVASFTVASTPRTFDRQSERVEGRRGTLFLRCTDLASSGGKRRRIADHKWHSGRSFTGRLKQRSFETREGEKRTVIELEVDEVGPSLRYATAKVNRTQRGSSGGGFGGSGGGAGGGAPADDPWGSAPPAGDGGGYSDEPPF